MLSKAEKEKKLFAKKENELLKKIYKGKPIFYKIILSSEINLEKLLLKLTYNLCKF